MIELVDVSVTFDANNGKVDVVKDISLSFEDKEIYVMTGPNGGGKSSLAKAIMGIYQPSSGQILFDGVDITHKSIDERARLGIGYAFQHPPRFKGLTVREMLRLAAGKDNDIDECALLYDVGLCAKDYLDREMDSSLSGGEIKRIEIASIIARKLKFVVFDEPEAGIDLWSFQRLTETFEKLHQKYDTTIVIISHQERILRLASQVILVENGRIGKITSHEKIFDEIGYVDSKCMCRRSCTREGRANAGCDR